VDAARPFDARLLTSLHGLEWRARYVMEGFLPGLHGSPFHGASIDFRDYREYQPGDDPRRLDWRLYARNDRLYIRRYEQETNARCYLVLDTSASMGYRGTRAWGEKLEAARVVAGALAWMLLGQGDAVGLVAMPDAAGAAYVRPSPKTVQAGALFREIGRRVVSGGPVLGALLERTACIASRRSLVVLLSDLLEPTDAAQRGLARLRFDGHECVCIQILDGDEIDFPFDDDRVFLDMETGERRRVAPREARAKYQARLAAFLDGWKAMLRDLDIRHALVRTDEDPTLPLRRLFADARRARARR